MNDQQARDAVIEMALRLHHHGYVMVTGGNVSLRLDEVVYITPSRRSYYQLNSGHIVRVDLAGQVQSGERPSSELASHLAIYRARPGTFAVIHAHPIHTLASSLLFPQHPFPPLTPDFVVKVGRVGIIDFFMPGSKELSEVLVSGFKEGNIVLIRNHGVFAAGTDLEEAFEIVEQTEAIAKLNLLCGGRGKTLSEQEIKKLIEEYSQKGGPKDV